MNGENESRSPSGLAEMGDGWPMRLGKGEGWLAQSEIYRSKVVRLLSLLRIENKDKPLLD